MPRRAIRTSPRWTPEATTGEQGDVVGVSSSGCGCPGGCGNSPRCARLRLGRRAGPRSTPAAVWWPLDDPPIHRGATATTGPTTDLQPSRTTTEPARTAGLEQTTTPLRGHRKPCSRSAPLGRRNSHTTRSPQDRHLWARTASNRPLTRLTCAYSRTPSTPSPTATPWPSRSSACGNAGGDRPARRARAGAHVHALTPPGLRLRDRDSRIGSQERSQ